MKKEKDHACAWQSRPYNIGGAQQKETEATADGGGKKEEGGGGSISHVSDVTHTVTAPLNYMSDKVLLNLPCTLRSCRLITLL